MNLKKNFGLENYLISCSFNVRKIFTKLRTSTHRLNIEVGRHNGVSRQNRLCHLCNNSDIEDESHFMIVCQHYSDIRTSLMNNLEFCNIHDLCDNDLFVFLMSYNDGDTEVLRHIITYVNSAYDRRFPQN